MKVKFLEAREVADGEGVVYQRFKAGQVYELSTASARHWINRSAALEVQGRAEKPVAKLVKSPDTKPEAKPDAGLTHPTFPKRGRGRPRSVLPPAPASNKPK